MSGLETNSKYASSTTTITFSGTFLIKFSSLAESTKVPVGLFGLQTTSIFVFGVIAESIASRL